MERLPTGTISFGYDSLNRLSNRTYSDSTPTVGYLYDANSNATSMTDGAGTETHTFDDLDRMTAVSRGGDVFSSAYDAASNITSRTYPGGTTTLYTYDAAERMATETSGGAATSYGYDPAGNLTTTTRPSTTGLVETRSYDRAGRLTSVSAAKSGVALSASTLTLDAAGNPTQSVDALGAITTYSHDAMNRITGVCYQSSCPLSADPFIRWTYDNVGNRMNEARATGTTTYSYNTADELTSATESSGTTSYTYDTNGNETSASSRTFTWCSSLNS